MFSIRKSFSSKLSLGIVLLAVPIFVVSIWVLYTQSRHLIREGAVDRANSVLTVTMQRICRNLNAIINATDACDWLVGQHLQPDSLLSLTNRIVRLNPHIDGCSISMEPNVFPQFGRHFSAYTIREDDTITTVVEQEYEYFTKTWYRTPRDLDKPCWVVYYDDVDSLELVLSGMLASYGKRLYDSDNRFVGIISTDLSLRRLSEVFSAEKPYPNSYFMMVDDEGRYFIHPDSTMLFTHTVFNGADPRRNPDIIALGHEMTAGKAGSMPVVINGVPSFVCYRPVPGTTWSLAIVCPDSDIMKGYHKLNIIMMPLLVAGLFIILLFSRRAVAHAIRPLGRLLEQTQSIASGNYEVYIPHTRREDAVGRLQNSFAAMLQSLNFHMGSIRYTADVAKSRNEELTRATRMAEEADRQKTTFIQNMSHQIRTPLNIIMGFAQILRDTVSPPEAPAPASSILSDDEKKSITDAMLHNALLLNRMVLMLFDSSDSGLTEELNTSRSDMVSCNAVARESISYAGRYYPDLAISFQSSVDDNYCIQTSHIYLMRSLRELLYNAAKYSDRQHVSMRVETTDTTVRFVVEDTGKGIAEADRDQMFKFFTKVDDLSEGLGLGLPLSKRHAQNLGGDLTLDTGYTAGCRFILELPLTSPTQG